MNAKERVSYGSPSRSIFRGRDAKGGLLFVCAGMTSLAFTGCPSVKEPISEDKAASPVNNPKEDDSEAALKEATPDDDKWPFDDQGPGCPDEDDDDDP